MAAVHFGPRSAHATRRAFASVGRLSEKKPYAVTRTSTRNTGPRMRKKSFIGQRVYNAVMEDDAPELVPCLTAPLPDAKELLAAFEEADIPAMLTRDACCGK